MKSLTDGLTMGLLAGVNALTRYNTTFTFLRHANAVAANGGHDSLRRISIKGKRQCGVQKENFQKLQFDAVFASPLPRVPDTIQELGGTTKPIQTIPQLVVECGAETRLSGVLDAAYDILGNVGLAKFFASKEVANALDIYAAIALMEIEERLKILEGWKTPAMTVGPGFHILVAGHGLLSPTIAYYLAGTNELARRHLLNNGMGECELIRIGLSEAGEKIWERTPCPACD